MTKVWVVTSSEGYSPSRIDGVFDSEVKAEDFVKALPLLERCDCTIEECEVQ